MFLFHLLILLTLPERAAAAAEPRSPAGPLPIPGLQLNGGGRHVRPSRKFVQRVVFVRCTG